MDLGRQAQDSESLYLSVTVMDYPKENLLQITPLKGRDL